MVIEGSREYKAAQELERALNDYSWNPKRFAESTRCYHRTLPVSYTHLRAHET